MMNSLNLNIISLEIDVFRIRVLASSPYAKSVHLDESKGYMASGINDVADCLSEMEKTFAVLCQNTATLLSAAGRKYQEADNNASKY